MNQFTHPVGRRSATLTGYVQQTSSALPNLNVCPAVLICPGGGYAYCTDREAEPVALAFLNAGYNAFVLRYTSTCMTTQKNSTSTRTRSPCWAFPPVPT